MFERIKIEVLLICCIYTREIRVNKIYVLFIHVLEDNLIKNLVLTNFFTARILLKEIKIGLSEIIIFKKE